MIDVQAYDSEDLPLPRTRRRGLSALRLGSGIVMSSTVIVLQ